MSGGVVEVTGEITSLRADLTFSSVLPGFGLEGRVVADR